MATGSDPGAWAMRYRGESPPAARHGSVGWCGAFARYPGGPGCVGRCATVLGLARKVETIVTLTDDLDGGKAERTIGFAVDRVSYEIELSKRNAAAFEKALRPYVQAAGKAKEQGRRRGAARSSTSGRRSDLAAVREWARAHGYEVSDRGRLRASVVDDYDAQQQR